MPTYEYECNSCQHKWEEFQQMKDDPTETCPKCGLKTAFRKIGTGGGILFKGSGFYKTDYKDKK